MYLTILLIKKHKFMGAHLNYYDIVYSLINLKDALTNITEEMMFRTEGDLFDLQIK